MNDLNDSKSSFAIEGERPSSNRAARWGRAITQRGRGRAATAFAVFYLLAVTGGTETRWYKPMLRFSRR